MGASVTMASKFVYSTAENVRIRNYRKIVKKDRKTLFSDDYHQRKCTHKISYNRIKSILIITTKSST